MKKIVFLATTAVLGGLLASTVAFRIHLQINQHILTQLLERARRMLR